MSRRWYEHWLYKASRAERAGNRRLAIIALDRAETHTGDPDELFYLRNWRHRLEGEEAGRPPVVGPRRT